MKAEGENKQLSRSRYVKKTNKRIDDGPRANRKGHRVRAPRDTRRVPRALRASLRGPGTRRPRVAIAAPHRIIRSSVGHGDDADDGPRANRKGHRVRAPRDTRRVPRALRASLRGPGTR